MTTPKEVQQVELEAFETWDREVFALPNSLYDKYEENGFASFALNARWLAWQARAALQVTRAASALPFVSEEEMDELEQELRLGAPILDAVQRSILLGLIARFRGSEGVTQGAVIESVAKAIYAQWRGTNGYVPWVEGGNALQQDEARRLARNALSSPTSKTPSPADEHPLFGAGPRDWPEDFPHDNGQYMNRCATCGQTFTGHKRRFTCKVCAASPAEATNKGKNDDAP